jgi:hypothetical protein
MSAASTVPSKKGTQSLRSLYDTSLGPYLATQDAQVLATRRNRWFILIGGLAVAGGIMTWVFHIHSQGEILPAIAFGLAVVSIGLFLVMKGGLAAVVRDHVMAEIAKWLGLKFEAFGKGFDPKQFEILGLAQASTVISEDRLYGEIGGLSADMVAAKLFHESTSGAGSDAHTHTSVSFTGLLMRIGDPAPPTARFRLIPPAALSPKGMLRGTSTTIRGGAGHPRAELLAMLAAAPQQAPVTPTGDTAFDARFELHASAPDVAVALARLDAGTRAALLDIAGMFGGGAASVGFDDGGILLAFVTTQRFEIGPLQPPMAQFERVQHLAEQMGVLATIAERIRTARNTA